MTWSWLDSQYLCLVRAWIQVLKFQNQCQSIFTWSEERLLDLIFPQQMFLRHIICQALCWDLRMAMPGTCYSRSLKFNRGNRYEHRQFWTEMTYTTIDTCHSQTGSHRRKCTWAGFWGAINNHQADGKQQEQHLRGQRMRGSLSSVANSEWFQTTGVNSVWGRKRSWGWGKRVKV